MSILRLENVTYSYENKYQKNQVLKGISAEFERGKIYALIGKSGSGKSTALNLMVCAVCYLAGCVLSIILQNRSKVLELLRDKE